MFVCLCTFTFHIIREQWLLVLLWSGPACKVQMGHHWLSIISNSAYKCAGKKLGGYLFFSSFSFSFSALVSIIYSLLIQHPFYSPQLTIHLFTLRIRPFISSWHTWLCWTAKKTWRGSSTTWNQSKTMKQHNTTHTMTNCLFMTFEGGYIVILTLLSLLSGTKNEESKQLMNYVKR